MFDGVRPSGLLMMLAVHVYDYLDLDLLIERSGSDYEVGMLSSPAGQTPPLPLHVPFSDLQIENLLLKIGRSGKWSVGSMLARPQRSRNSMAAV